MAEKTLTQILQEIEVLYNRFFALDDEITGYLEKGNLANYDTWEEEWSPLISSKLNEMISVLGFSGLRKADIKDYVDMDTFKPLLEEHKRLGDEQLKIQNSWAEHRETRVFSVAIRYYKDAPIGKFIYNRTKDSLKKLKDSDEAIVKIRALVKEVEANRSRIPAGSDFWPKYEEMKSMLAEMEATRKIIPFHPDGSIYKQYGLGDGGFTLSIGMILAIGAVIAVLYAITLVAVPLWTLVFKAYHKIVSYLNKQDEEESALNAEDKLVKGALASGKPVPPGIRGSVVDAIRKKINADLAMAKSGDEKTAILNSGNELIGKVVQGQPLTSQEISEAVSAVDYKTNKSKQELEQRTSNSIDRIISVVERVAIYSLVGLGLVVAGIGAIIVVPRIWPKKKEIQYVQATPGVIQQ